MLKEELTYIREESSKYLEIFQLQGSFTMNNNNNIFLIHVDKIKHYKKPSNNRWIDAIKVDFSLIDKAGIRHKAERAYIAFGKTNYPALRELNLQPDNTYLIQSNLITNELGKREWCWSLADQ